MARKAAVLLPAAAALNASSSTSGRAGTTRYWDCSGGSCGFAIPGDAIQCPNPGCSFPWGDPKCSPHDWAPRWMQHDGESLLFAGAAASDLLYCGQGSGCAGWGDGQTCGKCYLLSNPGGCSSGAPKLQRMIVRVTNLCPGQYNTACNNQYHFDISAPGFDYSGTSTSNVCTNGAANCDPSVFGSDACAYGAIEDCDCTRVSSDQTLVDGCNNFKMLGWDNCAVDFEEVECPTQPSPAPSPVPPSPEPTPTPEPTPAPTPAPTPTPSCPGGSLHACLTLCPSESQDIYKVCVDECLARCTGSVQV